MSNAENGNEDDDALPHEFGREIGDEFYENLTNRQQKRFRAAFEGEFGIYPAGPGMYEVFSHKSDDEDLSQYSVVYPKHNRPKCECNDYLFRCVKDETDISRCKHLWRVWLEIHAGYLPPPDANPYNWLLRRATDEMFALIDELNDLDEESDSYEQTKRHARNLRGLRRHLESSSPDDVDFESVFEVWELYIRHRVDEDHG